MADLARWDPWSDLVRFFEEPLFRPRIMRRGEVIGAIPLDVYETADEYVVKASLPGVQPENVDVTFEGGVLTVRGEIHEEKQVEGDCICQERRYGKFARSVSLPGDVLAEEISANLKDGILTLTVPKAERMKPRKIAVSIE